MGLGILRGSMPLDYLKKTRMFSDHDGMDQLFIAKLVFKFKIAGGEVLFHIPNLVSKRGVFWVSLAYSGLAKD